MTNQNIDDKQATRLGHALLEVAARVLGANATKADQLRYVNELLRCLPGEKDPMTRISVRVACFDALYSGAAQESANDDQHGDAPLDAPCDAPRSGPPERGPASSEFPRAA